MKTVPITLALLWSLTATVTYATNGDILTGEGPVSQALGGVGVAAPQDVITAISANPAALSLRTGLDLTPEKPSEGLSKDGKTTKPAEVDNHGLEIDFDATAFLPHVKGEINGVNGTGKGNVYPIPEIALAVPLTKDRSWYFGLAAYGSSGLGVDYRGSSLNNSTYYNFGGGNYAPLAAGTYTNYANLKFVPALSYRISSQWSVGLGVQVDYSTLDLGNGTSSAFSLGVNPGIIYHPIDPLTFGLSYTTPQPSTYNNVSDFNGDGKLDSLKLESPQEVVLGGAYEAFNHRLLFETNGKWINWSGAQGYKDFGWKDQWVAAVGIQYAIIPEKLFVRAGYNFGNNPVKPNDGFNGAYSPTNVTVVQGKAIPNYFYESFRIIGFPAVVENHASVGLGYTINEHLKANLAYTHAFANTVSEKGTNLFGQPTTISSKLSEDSVELGLTWTY